MNFTFYVLIFLFLFRESAFEAYAVIKSDCAFGELTSNIETFHELNDNLRIMVYIGAPTGTSIPVEVKETSFKAFQTMMEANKDPNAHFYLLPR